MKLSILILAAGNSSRLGHPKQMVEFRGQTLIERTVTIAKSITEDVLVVLGSNVDKIKTQINTETQIIINSNWQEGMGTSIRIGVEVLAKNADAILILLSDQPFISQALLQNMVQTFAESQQPIVVCDYGNDVGVPMVFDKSIFPELLKLNGNKGAKSFLNRFEDKIAKVQFPEGLIDIDTHEDVVKMLNMS
jgi:molybdenum cofactor cytidylyltransferase